MQKIKLFLSILIFLLVFDTISLGQNKLPQDSNFTGHSYFKISTDYISNNVYLGRKDSAIMPYLIPGIGYYHRSGLFVEGSLSLIPKNDAKVDLFTIDGGYDFHSKDEKFTGEIFAAKYFFNDSSRSVQSEISGEADAIAAYDFGFISINGGIDVLFSNPADVMLDAGLSHSFTFGSNDDWSVTPTFLTNIGSLNFYKNYYKKRKLKKLRSLRVPVTISGKNNFSALDYEFSLPLAYDTKKWSFLVSPDYAIPVDPIKYSVNGNFVKEEKLSNSFYVEASAAFKF